jgi:hypothetical protein
LLLKEFFMALLLYVDWIDLAQDRDQWRTLYEDGNEPPASIKGGEFSD